MVPDTFAAAGLAEFVSAHDALLKRLHEESGASRWNVSYQDFVRSLFSSSSSRFAGQLPDGAVLGQYLGALHLADLALVCALRRGSAAAWEEFIAAYRPQLYAAARAIAASGGEARARDLADSLYAELYGLDSVGGARRLPLLDYFHGRSKLSTWLRAILAQRHVDALRDGRRSESFDDSPAALRPAARARGDVAGDPDRARLLPCLRQAVAGALTAAAAGDRLLLSLYYLQGMTLAQIARLQGVHEATISRQLDRIRRDLRASIERALAAGGAAENGRAAHPGLSRAEVELCFAYALEDWSFDLGGAIGGDGRKSPEEL